MLEPDRLVITGLGTVNVLGYGKEHSAAGFLAPAPEPSLIEASVYHHRIGARRAFRVDPSAVKDHLPASRARRLSALSRSAVIAARLALADAGLTEAKPLGRSTAVVMSTAFGASQVTEEILRSIFEQGPAAASPFLFPESVASAPASQIAIDCGARGANLTLTQRSAGDLLALHRAATLLRTGRARHVLVGSANQIDPLLHAVLDRFRALSRPRPGKPEAGRPFDRDRDGFMLGEGSTVLVLELASTAAERGRPPLARLLAGGGAFDPSAPASDWGEGVEPLVSGLRTVLDRAAVAPGEISRLITGASGARRGDALEGRVLRRIWECDMPPVIAPKAWCGEHSGALLAAAVLAASGAGFAPCPGFETPDPDLRITPAAAGPIEPGGRLLLSSLAPGGSAAWAVLEGVGIA